jgi:hypothetical protein
MDETPKNCKNKRHKNCFSKSVTRKDDIYGDIIMHARWEKLNPVMILKRKKCQKSSSLPEVLFKYMKKPGWLDNVWSM